MRMHDPPHPGEIIKALCLEPLGVTVTKAADTPGVSRETLSAILNGRAGISPEMAVRLSIAFDTSAESQLNQQTQYDLWPAHSAGSTFASPSKMESALTVTRLAARWRPALSSLPPESKATPPFRHRLDRTPRCQ